MAGLDIAAKIGIGLGAFFGSAALVIVPNGKQKDQAALDMYDRPLKELSPADARAAEFAAGFKRWNEFTSKVHSVTRKFPGADSPILNPYKGPRPLPGHLLAQQHEKEAAAAAEAQQQEGQA